MNKKQLMVAWIGKDKVKGRLQKVDFKKLVYDDNNKVRKQFKSSFYSEINNFIEEIFNTYKTYKLVDEKCIEDKQKSYAVGYLFNAMDTLITSLNLLISGYLVVAGNLYRQFVESIAMAILISHKELPYFEKLMGEGNDFPFHKAAKFVLDNRDKLKMDSNGWNTYVKIRKFYHKYSHPSLLAIGNRFNFGKKNMGILGGNYDPEKIEIYKVEIEKRIVGVKSLKNICEGIFFDVVLGGQ